MGISVGVTFMQLALIRDSGFCTKLPSSHAARRAGNMRQHPVSQLKPVRSCVGEGKIKDSVSGWRHESLPLLSLR